MKGKVKHYNENKGFGFIEGEDSQDYFFHVSQMKDQSKILEKGDEVEFDATQNDRGLAATNVALVQ